ncbi:TonB-dependent receptor [Bacteroides thetaiotaomicron]|uniref:TonB-dependent receptor n=2 Tax=Bacteroides thetaiotaomicron TaxID=818 RepID=A0A7J5JAU2_BACT4|nr:TonB-dependent receptor [Bacteroides thetaiotaomicron]KAB4426212.1 TonB-dependent receptor [Bacteroides thetaiotaomicron]KAB4428969.1 TonB-dependent receptor [Bacteroides thetaiotaomicron]KAB4441145.1 TonB-dependent receptor [Bacteroides thetaiotaomicron]KAB4447174.1 TonB-dependent receptor [Bacteroides thetaiotaomicron]
MGTWAQNIVVTGVVTDAQKEPLIGVNVAVKDVPGLGAITDINGKYKISIEPYQRLIFSYVGFDKVEVLIKEQRVVNVSMKESAASSLDEVVITGTGVQKKLTVTGAITTVNVSDLTHTANGNVVNALAGNVAGVLAMQTSGQPGRNTSEFWIRGISTFGASTSALVLVDGFERDLDDVNIEDIESFSVLKDASATAIYGSRGANGVVLITTKHGKAGKINIDAKVETSYNTRTITPKFVDGYTYATMMNEARITRNQEPIYQQDELDLLRMGLDPDLYPNVDWTDLLLKDGAMTYRANVNMNGGGSTARYFVSLSYLKEDGMYKTDETLRKDYNTNANANTWNYRLNTDIDITKTTLLKVGVSGSLKKYNEPGLSGDVWKSLMYQNPISVPVMYSNGYVPAYGTGDRTNPWVLATQTGYKEHWENTIQSNLTLEQKLDFITQGLKFVGRFGFDTWNKNNIDRIKWPEQYKAQRFRDENGNLVFDRVTEEQKMKQTSSAEGNRNEIFEAELHYDRGFKEHHVGGLLKFNQDSKVFTVGTGEDIKKGIARRHLGLAGRVSYNWNYRYFVDFNFGYNGSENFADGHRFGFFPAVSAAWNVAEEPIIKKNLKWMNMFKIRYSFGKVGNDVLKIGDDEYRFPYLYTIGDGSGYTWADYNYNNSYSGKRYTDLASNYATWEIATKHDLGVDLALFNDKFTATVDYFHEQREGIWMERKYLPSIVGLGSNPRANVGKVLSEGFDGNFAFREKINKVDITVRGNITYSQNTILEKDEENNVYPYQMERDYRVNQAKGLIALGLFKDYDDIRNSPKQEFGTVQPGDIKYKDVNGDGVVNDGDKVAIGATTKPNMIYGFGISASWKGLDVNVHFQGAGKTSFFIEGATVHAFSAGEWGNILSDVANSNRWIDHEISGTMATENPNASYPRLSYGGNSNNYRQSTFWLRNGSYLRLKTLELGYSIPKPLVNKIRFNNIRLFLRGSNLLTFSSFKLWDPELGSSTGTEYPLAKSLTLGLSVNL